MSAKNDVLRTFKGVLLEPSVYFESEDRRGGWGYPLRFALVALIFSGILSSFFTVLVGRGLSFEFGLSGVSIAFLGVADFFLAVFSGLIGIFVMALLIHVFVYLFHGANGFNETLGVVAYGSAVTPLIAALMFVPILGSILGFALLFYVLYIYIRGVEIFQELSLSKAIASVMLPTIIVIVFTGMVALMMLIIFLAVLSA